MSNAGGASSGVQTGGRQRRKSPSPTQFRAVEKKLYQNFLKPTRFELRRRRELELPTQLNSTQPSWV